MITLKKMRGLVTTPMFKGPETDDSRISKKYYDNLIFMARGFVADELFKIRGELAPEWYTDIPILVEQSKGANSNYFYGTIPGIISLPADLGIRIKGGDDPSQIVYLSRSKKTRFRFNESSAFKATDPMFDRSGNTVYFYNITKTFNAKAEAIVFNLYDIPQFSENSVIPMCSKAEQLMLELIQSGQIKELKHGKQDPQNDSVLPIQSPKGQEE